MSPAPNAALFGVSILLLIAPGCRSTEPVIVTAPIPDGTETVVVSLEQEDRRAVFAHPVSEGALEVELPDVTEAPISVVRLSFREPITDFGLSRSAPLPREPEYSRPLSSLSPLGVEAATVAEDSSTIALRAGTAPAWLLDEPIWRADTCLESVRGEIAFDSGLPRATIALDANLAAAISDSSVAFVRPGEAPVVFALRPEERGRGAALGGDGRWWVLSSSRAMALDSVTGQVLAEHALPKDLDPLGMTEDPSSGDLYFFSTDAELWRQSSSSTVAEVFYVVPSDRVRRSSLAGDIARFYFVADQTLLMAVEDVNAVLEVKDGVVRLVSEVVPDSGYVSFQDATSKEVFLVERDSQSIYRYLAGALEPVGRASFQVKALSTAVGPTMRLVYASSRGSIGSYDLIYSDSCPEVWLEGGELVEGLSPVGERFLAIARHKPERPVFYWVDLIW